MDSEIIVQVALRAEARPLIEHFRLKRDLTFAKFEVFRGGPTVVVSGVGPLAAAVAATHILTARAGAVPALLNFGCAGSPDRRREIGTLFLINQVTDHSTGRSYYPDLPAGHGLPETGVTTFARPVGAEGLGSRGAEGREREDARERVPADFPSLVDMEAAGCLSAALTFLAPHRVGCVKLVSDHLDYRRLTAAAVTGLVRDRLPELERLLARYAAAPADPEFLTEIDALVSETAAALRLTAARRHILREALLAYRARTGRLPERPEFPPVRTKADSGRHFADLLRQLNGA